MSGNKGAESGKGAHKKKKTRPTPKNATTSKNAVNSATAKSPGRKPAAPNTPPQNKAPTTPTPEKAAEKITLFGKDVPKPVLPSVELNSKAYAGMASVCGAGLMATNFVPGIKPLSIIFKGAAHLAMGAADTKKAQEREKSWCNHQEHAAKLARTVRAGPLLNKPASHLTARDYVQLSFLTDKDQARLATPVQVEVLKVQILLEVEALQGLGVDVPGRLQAFSVASAHLHNKGGIARLRAERTRVWDLMDEVKSGQYDAEKSSKDNKNKQVRALVRLGAMQGVGIAARRAGKYGKYLSGIFNVADGAQVMQKSAQLIMAAPEPSFTTADEYIDYLVTRLEKIRAQDRSPPAGPGRFSSWSRK